MFHPFSVSNYFEDKSDDEQQYMGPLDFKLKDNYIFNNSYFIFSNEFLFKQGVYKLKSRLSNNPIKRLHQISNNKKAYTITKPLIETRKKNLLQHSPKKGRQKNNKYLYKNYINNASNFNSKTIDQKEKQNTINSSDSRNIKKPNQDISILNKKYLIKSNNTSNIINKSNSSNKLSKSQEKKNNNHKSQTIQRNTSTISSINNEKKNAKSNILLPKMKIPKNVFDSNLKKQLIYSTDGEKEYLKLKKYKKTEKMLDTLKKTQLRFIKKHQTELFKRNHSPQCGNFNWVLNDYLSKHKHENFFSFDAADSSSKIVKTFNILESTKNKIPKMRETLNYIESVYKEAEELKMKISNEYLPEDTSKKKRKKIKDLKFKTEIPKNKNKNIFKNFYKTPKFGKKVQRRNNFQDKNYSKLTTTEYNNGETLYGRVCDLFRQNMKLNEKLYEFRK